MPITSTEFIIRTGNYPDSGNLLNYNDDDYSQAYGQIKETFRVLTKHNLLQLYISEGDFRSSNDGSIIGYILHAFDIRYQKNLKAVNWLQ